MRGRARGAATVAPAKCEHDLNDINNYSAKVKLKLAEKFTNGMMVSPTIGQQVCSQMKIDNVYSMRSRLPLSSHVP